MSAGERKQRGSLGLLFFYVVILSPFFWARIPSQLAVYGSKSVRFRAGVCTWTWSAPCCFRRGRHSGLKRGVTQAQASPAPHDVQEESREDKHDEKNAQRKTIQE